MHRMKMLKPDIKILLLSLEQTSSEWMERAHRIHNFYEPGSSITDTVHFWKDNLFLVEKNRVSLDELEVAVDQFRYETGSEPDLVVIDYLGYFARSFGSDEYGRLSDAIMALKGIAKTAELADENDWVSNRVRGYLVPILHKCTFHEPELKSADAAGGNAGPSNFLNLGDLAINEAKSFPGDFKAQIAPVQSKAPSINIQGPAKTDAKKMPSILDPDAENEMHSLALTSPLNNLLASDSSFSAYPKNKIIHAYNEILSAYPRVASNPVTLRPALQRHLAAGGLDEFSLNNLVSQEEKQTNINRSPNVQPPVV
jgi:hypothetical protein